jgi:two-component system OmpR family sensor kinase
MRGGLRRRLTVSVSVIAAVTLVVLIAAFNLALRSSLSSDADSLLSARAQAALEGLNVENGEVSVGETSDAGAPDAQVWIYSGSRNIERPPAADSLDRLAASLRLPGSGKAEDDNADARLLAVPILDGNSRAGTVVAAVSVEPYEVTAERALIGSIVLGLVVLILIALVTRTILNRALQPVARMTRDAADWSVHDLDRRFHAGPADDELTRLAATFDGMLDRMSAMVRHERNFSAELSHELRTPLSSIAAESELALRRERSTGEYREAIERIHARARELAEIVETMLSVARAEGSPGVGESCDLAEVAASAVRSAGGSAAAYGISIELVPGPGSPVLGAAETVQRIVAPVLENACVFARSTVRVVVGEGETPVLRIADDGPGFEPGESEAVFEPGHSGDTPRNPGAPQGTGLGLALARRLARALGGEVEITRPEGPGAEVTISLPPVGDD